jgi:hypothetical protein
VNDVDGPGDKGTVLSATGGGLAGAAGLEDHPQVSKGNKDSQLPDVTGQTLSATQQPSPGPQQHRRRGSPAAAGPGVVADQKPSGGSNTDTSKKVTLYVERGGIVSGLPGVGGGGNRRTPVVAMRETGAMRVLVIDNYDSFVTTSCSTWPSWARTSRSGATTRSPSTSCTGFTVCWSAPAPARQSARG